MGLLHGASGEMIASRVEVAATWLRRFLGLMGRAALADGGALVIRPCASVHTFFMRFPIDVVFLDEGGEIVDLRHAVPPGRICLAPGDRVREVVELPAGRCREAGLRVGDRLLLVRSESR